MSPQPVHKVARNLSEFLENFGCVIESNDEGVLKLKHSHSGMVIQAEDSIFTEYSVKASSIGSQSSKLLQLKSFGSHDEAKLAKSNLNPDNLQTKGILTIFMN